MNKKMNYGLYDANDNDTLLGIFTLQELIKYLNVSKNTIHTCVHYKTVLRKKYRIERIGYEND